MIRWFLTRRGWLRLVDRVENECAGLKEQNRKLQIMNAWLKSDHKALRDELAIVQGALTKASIEATDCARMLTAARAENARLRRADQPRGEDGRYERRAG